MSVIGYSWGLFSLSKLDGRLRTLFLVTRQNDLGFLPRVSPKKRVIEGTIGDLRGFVCATSACRFVNQSPC